jgi:hypothetical protein
VEKNESETSKTQFHSNSQSFRNFSGGALELLTVKLECDVCIKDGCNSCVLLFLPCNAVQHGRRLPTFIDVSLNPAAAMIRVDD